MNKAPGPIFKISTSALSIADDHEIKSLDYVTNSKGDRRLNYSIIVPETNVQNAAYQVRKFFYFWFKF